jgi:hypothetical protein
MSSPLDHDDDDSDLIFDSPPPETADEKQQSDPTPRFQESRFTTEEAREAALRQELENIKRINQVVEGVVESLEKAKANMDVSF